MSARTPHTPTHIHTKSNVSISVTRSLYLSRKWQHFFLKCQAATFFICSGWWSDSRSMTLEELSIGGTRVAMSSSHRLPCCRHVATAVLSPEIIFHLQLTVTGSAWSQQAAILPLVGCCLSIFLFQTRSSQYLKCSAVEFFMNYQGRKLFSYLNCFTFISETEFVGVKQFLFHDGLFKSQKLRQLLEVVKAYLRSRHQRVSRPECSKLRSWSKWQVTAWSRLEGWSRGRHQQCSNLIILGRWCRKRQDSTTRDLVKGGHAGGSSTCKQRARRINTRSNAFLLFIATHVATRSYSSQQHSNTPSNVL